LSGAKRRLGFAPGRECSHVFYNERAATPTAPIHAVDRAMLLLEPLGATFEGLPLRRRYLAENPGCCGYSPAAKDLFPLPIGEADTSAVDAFLREANVDFTRERLVVLNPHCRNPANIWPTVHFAALAERLLQHRELKVVVTGGPVAKPMCDQIAAHNGGRVLRADGRFSILGSAELIRRASVFVTGDTGPMHIAAAVGTPIVAMLGPTMPMKTGPYATDAVVLRKQLHCSPCLARQCPLNLDPPPCMDEITVDAVYAATLARLAETSSTDVQRKSA
jgi:ADP-heptose:LPS heptosyltransferase